MHANHIGEQAFKACGNRRKYLRALAPEVNHSAAKGLAFQNSGLTVAIRANP
jgi:hypothetical protein